MTNRIEGMSKGDVLEVCPGVFPKEVGSMSKGVCPKNYSREYVKGGRGYVVVLQIKIRIRNAMHVCNKVFYNLFILIRLN